MYVFSVSLSLTILLSFFSSLLLSLAWKPKVGIKFSSPSFVLFYFLHFLFPGFI